jgi:hypothetical protein
LRAKSARQSYPSTKPCLKPLHLEHPTFSPQRFVRISDKWLCAEQIAFSETTIYEIIPRTGASLPMPPTKTSDEIQLGILGRTQRDSKVELCHFVDMNNHSHTVAVSNRCTTLSKFYMSFKRRRPTPSKHCLDYPPSPYGRMPRRSQKSLL